MKFFLHFLISTSLFPLFSFGQQHPITLGFSDSIPSAILGKKQVVNIYLPEGYDPDSTKTYPVIYLLDGAVEEDFIHIAGLVQFSSFSWVNYLPPSILVGIVSTDRQRDMTFKPSPNFVFPEWLSGYKDAYANAGGSENFMSYLAQELKPYMAANYKVNQQSTLIGQSLAGLFATEVLLKKPTLFTKYIIMSPSLWWDNESLLKEASTLAKQFPDTAQLQVYLAVGKEGKEMENDAKNLARVLQKVNPKKVSFTFEYLPKEDHGTILHQAVGNAFERMYPALREGE